MGVYPKQIADILSSSRCSREVVGDDVAGIAARIECGCVVTIGLRFDDAGERIAAAGFRTNGCGYMAASSETTCRSIQGIALTALGSVTSPLADVIFRERTECADAASRALAAALARHRENLIDEFIGEKALVCTCFGVGEETIVRFAAERPGAALSDVASELRAGSGCGACRLVIQEILDAEAQ